MSFYRTPSPLEFTYIAADTPDYSPMVNQFILQGEGDITHENLALAAEKVIVANPGFCLKLKGFWGWRYWDDEGKKVHVEEISAPEWDSRVSAHAPVLGDPINLRKDSGCQIYLIHAANGLHIVFRIHHAITDGRGTLHFMFELFRALRGESLLGSNSKVCEWDIATREKRPERSVKEGQCMPVIKGTIDPSLTKHHWHRFDWPGNKNNLMAKLIHALNTIAQENYGEGKVLFRVPSDLRRYMSADEGFTIANCSGAIDLELPSKIDVKEIRKIIVRALRQNQDIAPFKEPLKNIKWWPQKIIRPTKERLIRDHSSKLYRMTGIISYMGELNLNHLSCADFQTISAFGVPIPFETRPIFVAASTYNGITNFIIGCPKATANPDELAAFTERLSEVLHSL